MPLLVDPPSTSMFSSSFSTAMAERAARPSTTIARETLGSARGGRAAAAAARGSKSAVRDALDARRGCGSYDGQKCPSKLF